VWTLTDRPAGLGNDDEGEAPVFSADAPAFAHLERLLAWFRDEDLPIVVVYIPNSPGTEARWEHAESWVGRKIADICREQGVAYLDCRESGLPRTDADYVDVFHVSLPFAQRLSRWVAQATISLQVIAPAEQRIARGPAGDKETR
jgi:hypothetical protein